MKKISTLALVLVLSACASQPINDSKFVGLAFGSFDGKKVAVFDNLSGLDVAYADRDTKQVRVFTAAKKIEKYDDPSACYQSCRIDSEFGGRIVIPLRKNRVIAFTTSRSEKDDSSQKLVSLMALNAPLAKSTPVIICGNIHNPCAVTEDGCGGSFGHSEEDSPEDIVTNTLEKWCDNTPDESA